MKHPPTNNDKVRTNGIRTVQRFMKTHKASQASSLVSPLTPSIESNASNSSRPSRRTGSRIVRFVSSSPTNPPLITITTSPIRAIITQRVSLLRRSQPSSAEGESASSPSSKMSLRPQTTRRTLSRCQPESRLPVYQFDVKSKPAKDYHRNFNSQNYTKWFKEDLLPNLKEPSLIVMDNAAYHTALPEGAMASAKGKKELAVKYVMDNGIPFDAKFKVQDLKKLVKEHITSTVQPTMVALANAAAHRVLFTPPHHSDVQPIEMVWAIVKGQVGRKYSYKTSFKAMQSNLKEAFAFMESDKGREQIRGMIAKSYAVGDTYRQIDEGEVSESDAVRQRLCIYEAGLDPERAKYLADALEMSSHIQIGPEYMPEDDDEPTSGEEEDSDSDAQVGNALRVTRAPASAPARLSHRPAQEAEEAEESP